MKKKLLFSLMLSILCILIFGAVNASAATLEDLTYKISNGEVTITDCRYLASGELIIPAKIDGYPVTAIGEDAFYGCSSLTSITIPDGVTSIGEYAFSDCSSLTSITLPDGVTSIGEYAFFYCSSLTSITIPDGVTSIGEYAFGGCSSLTSINIPDSVTTIGYRAFGGCSSLISITIPDGVTSIGEYAFDGCSSLTSINIPDSVTTIGEFTFSECSSLTSITIPDGVTSIGDWAFGHCYKLASISIPNSVTSIGDWAFYGSYRLTKVYYNGTQDDWNKITIGSDNDELTSATKIFFYYVTVVNEVNGKLYEWENVGSKLDISSIDNKDGYTIRLYTDKEYKNEFDISTPLVKNITLYLKYAIKQYTYRFVDDNGSVIKEATIDYGTEIIKPIETISKPATQQYTYTFAGWDGYTDGMTIEDDVTFTAKYISTINKYSYKFVGENGSIILEDIVDYGTKIVAPASPSKPATQQYTYAFAGWDGYTDGMTIENDITFTAKYTATVNKYTYSFLNDNGSVVYTKAVEYGTKITLPSTPSKPATQQYTYTFAVWDGYTDGMTIEEDITFTAKYTTTINKYTYTFVDENGSLISENSVDYGTKIVAPENPSKPATQQYTYTFAGWDGYTDGMTIEDDVTFTAIYTSTINKYTYTFVDENGSVIVENTVDYSTVIVAPSMPADKDPYTFERWEGYTYGMSITEDIIFTAVYKYKNYTINIDDISQPQVVTYNSSFTLPTQTRGDYNFMGYYTDKYGNGTKITDETGASLTVYNIVGDINVYPYFVSAYINKVVLTDDTTTIPGSTIKLNPTFATDKEASYLTVVISYPSELRYKKIKSLDYAEATVEGNTSKDGYTYLDIICVYDYNGNSAPLNTKLIPFELEFEVTTDAPVGEISICVDEFYLIGNSDYTIDNIDNATINIQPKLAEHITIQGENTIEKSTKYYAVVYPDYTTNKNIIWSVDNENIATISVDGILTPVRNGNVTIIATAADGSGVYGTKTVSIVSYASIDSLDFGNGVVLTSFNPETRQYTVYVKDDVDSITLTPTFTNGVLRPNGVGLWISGREKSFELTNDETTIVLNRGSVEGKTDSEYTITVIKYSGTKTSVSDNRKEFVVQPINIDDNCTVIIAVYNNGIMTEIQKKEYTGEAIDFSIEEAYTEVKIMLWDGEYGLRPMCKAEILK